MKTTSFPDDVKGIHVVLQFELVDSFDESYVKECPTYIKWGYDQDSLYGILLTKLHYSPCSVRLSVFIHLYRSTS